MIESKQAAVARHPRWDGGRILFEVADGGRSVACTISVNALQDLSGQRRLKPAADLLACFDEVRARIGAIALAKLRSRTAGATGLLYVWSDDIEDPPPASAPAAALRVDASREPEPDRVRAAPRLSTTTTNDRRSPPSHRLRSAGTDARARGGPR